MKIIGTLGNKDVDMVLMKRGYMPGLAKHLSKKLGADPNFHTKCMGDESVAGYDEGVRASVCAKAHKMVTGIWPGEHGGKNPNGPEAKKQIKWKYITKKTEQV
jgi:hypothetical protein